MGGLIFGGGLLLVVALWPVLRVAVDLVLFGVRYVVVLVVVSLLWRWWTT